MYRNVTANAALLKQLNRSSILRSIREQGELSRAMLARELKLSKPAVSTLVDELISQNWLVESGSGDSTGGRKPVMLKINPDGGGMIGVIYNSYGLEMALMDFSGRTRVEEFTLVDDQLQGLELLEEICRNINSFIAANIHRVTRILGAGIGVPGAIRQTDGLMQFTPVKGWQGLALLEEFSRRISYPVFVENDSNLMALGEHSAGIGRAADSLVYINVGSGIGAGIILEGRLLRGYHDTAGEIGYLNFGNPVNAHLGHGGIFEGNYSARTIRKRFFSDKKLKALMPVAPEDNSSFLAQIRHLSEKNKAAAEFWEDILRNWAYAIAAVAATLSPQLIIMGGEMSVAGEQGREFILAEISKSLPFPLEVKSAVLGRKAGLLGAAHLVLDSDRALMNIGKSQ